MTTRPWAYNANFNYIHQTPKQMLKYNASKMAGQPTSMATWAKALFLLRAALLYPGKISDHQIWRACKILRACIESLHETASFWGSGDLVTFDLPLNSMEIMHENEHKHLI